jgi:hypothetical protein
VNVLLGNVNLMLGTQYKGGAINEFLRQPWLADNVVVIANGPTDIEGRWWIMYRFIVV